MPTPLPSSPTRPPRCPPATLSAVPDPTNRSVVLPRSEVQMETLAALYNLCMFNKTVRGG